MLVQKEPHAMDGLPHIWHVLWVHGWGLTSLGHNQYTRILFINTSEHPSGGTRFGENCKTTKPSSGLSILLGEEPHAMDGLPSTPYVLWVHRQRLILPGTQSIHRGVVHPSLRAPKLLWDQIWWELQNHKDILRIEYVTRWRTTCYGWVAKHSICFMSA